MTQDQYVIRRKLNILELGETLGNISEACRRLNISRQHHYDIKSAVAEEGIEGLLEKSRKYSTKLYSALLSAKLNVIISLLVELRIKKWLSKV